MWQLRVGEAGVRPDAGEEVMTIQFYDIENEIREKVTDECATCHGEWVAGLDGEVVCVTCGNQPETVLEQNLSPLREMEIELVASRLTLRVKEMTLEVDILDRHIDQMQERLRRKKASVERLKAWLKLEMEAAGLRKVTGPFGTAWIQRNPDSIEVTFEDQVPRSMKMATITKPLAQCTPEDMEFVKDISVMKSWVMEHLKETGELVQGVLLVDDRTHLRIR
ncbi:MAG TPA: siphovirus Gp157 family protein [Gemmatimonadaceae bacterium]